MAILFPLAHKNSKRKILDLLKSITYHGQESVSYFVQKKDNFPFILPKNDERSSPDRTAPLFSHIAKIRIMPASSYRQKCRRIGKTF